MLATSSISASSTRGVSVFIERIQASAPALKRRGPDAKRPRSVHAQTVQAMRRSWLSRVLQLVR